MLIRLPFCRLPARLPRRLRGFRAAPLCVFAALSALAVVVPAALTPPACAAPRLMPRSGANAAYAEADFSGWIPYITKWLKNGEQYLQYAVDNNTGAAQLMKVDAKTGKTTPFYDAAQMERALAKAGIVPASAKRLAHTFRLDLSDDETRVLLSSANDFYVYDLATGKAARLTNSPKTVKTNESFSPDARRIAYVSGNNLYAVDVSFDGKMSSPRALTTDGAPGVYNGRLDWVYEEEIYGRGKTDGYAWSADNRHIAFLRLDESPMKPFLLTDELPDPQGVEKQWYPKAGQPNPQVSLRVVDTDPAAAASPVYANVKGRPQKPASKKGDIAVVPLANYPDADRLLVRFAWTPTGDKLTYQVTNRTQTFLDLAIFDIKSGKADPLFREKTTAWVEIIDSPLWLKDGTFLWQSDRTGFRHLYHYKPDGTLIGAVTKGNWDVREVYGVDEKTKTVYFAGTEKSVIGQDVCRVGLDGANYARLTEKAGTHAGAFSPNFAYYAERWSDLTNAPQIRLVSTQTGAEMRVLDGSDETAGSRVSRFPDGKPELLEVKTRDGFVMNALLLKPANFDPAKKYPVYCPVYGGPGTQTVRNSWGTVGSFERMLASKGYIIWMCDNRSASGRGLQSQWPIYQQMGPGELADIEDGLTYLKTNPWVDASRIGISGWSFGGFLTEYALTHSKSFKIGVAGAGVSDWRLYDTVYTERYMKTPLENPTGYQDTAPANAAADCAGKLLILHGMMDDNVHLQNSIQLIYGLQKAGKDFQMMFYPSPSSRHGIGDPAQSRHLRDLETKFVLENL